MYIVKILTRIQCLIWKKDYYYCKVCKDVKNQFFFISHNWETIGAQLAHGVVGKKTRKIVQFTIIFHSLQQGHMMLEYESL
jgi:hypothetical protein